MQYKIAVLDKRLPIEAQKQIQALTTIPLRVSEQPSQSEQELIEQTGDANIVLVRPGDKITASYLDTCPSIKYVCLCGTSMANIDQEALKQRGIPFDNVVDYGDEPTAEFIFMQLTRLLRGVGPYQWRPEQHELMGRRIGIIGLGSLGKSIASLALAYHMQATYYSVHRKPDWESKGLAYKEKQDLLSTSEIIVIGSPSNVKVLGPAEFAAIKDGSIIVQASVGDVMDRTAFLAWIKCDGNFLVFDKVAGTDNISAYKDLPRVLYADTISGDTHETLQRLGQKVVANVKKYLEKTERA
ncbi:hypothetical protein JNM87_06825 [Candidatus Saccharibacteria bacterium]|nr:hypothetical protein [Candidatus Saccharibacteria bacterium]